ncbi:MULTISPECIES: ABC transporter permease [Bacillus]|uniref:ABC transporter permease n=1 Tax=Bacillus TaxID=1386 RepID=UPI000BB953B1|nr:MULTISPECIES: ABC transporter permease subunit [Bacillus]
MKNMLVLLRKEMVESVKNGKWIWLPIVFVIIGITQPISSYYMPQIIEMAGNLPEGAKIELPIPTGEEVLAGTLGQYGTIGTLLFVLATMGVISNERQNGSLTLVMVRPVSPAQYILSKWIGQLILTLVSLFLSYGLTWYYTNLLFNQVSMSAFFSSFLMYSLWIVFIVSLTILLGTVLPNNGGIAGASISILAALSLLTSLLTKFMEWSPATLRNQATNILLHQEVLETFFIATSATIILSASFVALAIFNFKRLERF